MKQIVKTYFSNSRIEKKFAITILSGWFIYFISVQLGLAGRMDNILESGVLFCPFKAVTGVQCPGCGMTRAFISLAKVNFSSAFIYNPFSIPLFIYLVSTLISFKKYKLNKNFSLTIKIFLLGWILSWWLFSRVF